MNVPFLDLGAQYAPIRAEVDEALNAVFSSTAFAGGPFVATFEEAFADYVNCEHAIGVGSGTEALWFALLALDVGPGDEVITVPNSFFATAEAISICGARPVFVDVSPDTLTMNPKALEAAITKNTRAIIPVHLFGQMADMDPILAIAERHDIPVIEDAAQAHGALYRGKPAGSLGIAGCFSFYPGKNLGAPGEAGAVTTHDANLALQIRILRDHGQAVKHDHQMVGWNGRMDGIHGAVLNTKLPYLENWNEARRAHAELYRKRLAPLPGLQVPIEQEGRRHVFHIYALRAQGRDDLMSELAERGVQCAIHYPVPIHKQAAYRDGNAPALQLPVAETSAPRLLSLPLYPELKPIQINYVCDQIERWVERRTVKSRIGRPPSRLNTRPTRREATHG